MNTMTCFIETTTGWIYYYNGVSKVTVEGEDLCIYQPQTHSVLVTTIKKKDNIRQWWFEKLD